MKGPSRIKWEETPAKRAFLFFLDQTTANATPPPMFSMLVPSDKPVMTTTTFPPPKDGGVGHCPTETLRAATGVTGKHAHEINKKSI